MTPETREMNRAMARYLGYEFNNGWKKDEQANDLDKRFVGLNKPFLCRTDDGLCFHQSWTWLMEVWKPLNKQVQLLAGSEQFPDALYNRAAMCIINGESIAAHSAIYDLLEWRRELLAQVENEI